MAQTSKYCKAYTAKSLRMFPRWTENTTSLRKGKKIADGREVQFDRAKIEDADILYLHDSYIVTDGIFKDEHIIFDNPTDEWKQFCQETLKFSILDDKKKDSTPAVK